MDNGYKTDRQWADQFLKQVREIIGPHLLIPSPLDQDVSRATDLIVLTGRDIKIACRIRRPGYFEKYPGEFTIRSRRDNNIKTEMKKIVDGWCDWMFYAHASEQNKLRHWYLIDLSVFRAHLIRDGMRENKLLSWSERSNGDGTSFVQFKIDSFPPDPPLLIASSETCTQNTLPF